jgi:SNF2 family DNA or RNA helicase
LDLKSKNLTAAIPPSSKRRTSKRSQKAAAAQVLSLTRPMLSGWYEKLYPEQELAARFVLSRLKHGGGAALLCEQGTGKTIVTLAIMEKLATINVLIVCPKTAIYATWGKRLPAYTVGVPRSTAAGKNRNKGFCLVSYKQFVQMRDRASRFRWDLVVFDEAQGLKDRNSAQSRAARKMRDQYRRLILTGTPIDEQPIDLWAQMRFVDERCFGDDWKLFAAVYVRKGGFMSKQEIFRQRQLKPFLKAVTPYCYRLKLEQLPAKIIPVKVYLDHAQQHIHDQMQEHGIVKVNGITFKAEFAAVKDLKCFQVVGGFLHQEGTTVRVGEAKYLALKKLIPKLKRPVIFCRFLEEMKDVEIALKAHYRRVEAINGSVTDSKTKRRRTLILEQFQAGLIDALVVQARTGGVSIEFSSTHECVFYSMGYSYIDFQQIVARFRRMGQTRRVLAYLLIARFTVDEEPYQRILLKAEGVKPVMKHIEEKST